MSRVPAGKTNRRMRVEKPPWYHALSLNLGLIGDIVAGSSIQAASFVPYSERPPLSLFFSLLLCCSLFFFFHLLFFISQLRHHPGSFLAADEGEEEANLQQ
ncbi:hypothetical protein XELAEV_18028248mg [Xenopus laevis]|uniref:Uncharacterized protein n=1 Tax=Xenopus laevis TaxID=8355 RepID=A0A974CX06_XENLA|nr:hypothetical protein XELAEV_18028248mg [Xenopus laevis]